MKNHNLFTYLFFAAVIFLASCKGKDGDVGPAGPAGQDYDPSKNYVYKEGFIKGTAEGTTLDGTDYSYNLDFEGNWDKSDNEYVVASPTETTINISKTYSGEGDAFIYGDFYLEFTVTSLSDLSSPSVDYASMDLTKDLGGNKVHEVYYSSSSGTVSNLVYNSTTGVLTGDYTFSVPASSTKGDITIADGSFSTKLVQSIARMSAQ